MDLDPPRRAYRPSGRVDGLSFGPLAFVTFAGAVVADARSRPGRHR